MRTPGLIGALGLALAGALAPPTSAQLVREGENQRFLPGEAIVTYERGTGPGERRGARGEADVRFEQSLALARTQLVTFDGPVRDAVARLENQPGVARAQPNYRYQALAAAPNDTHFGQLWGAGATPGVNVLPAWDRSRGAGQVIAIVDSGVDLTHPDLAGNLWTGPGGIHGRDFVDDDNHPDDFNLHGTHVAGTAAAVANNATGVAGVAPQAKIMAVRVLDGDGGGSSVDIAFGIVFAADNGASVINLSLGGPASGTDTFMQSAIRHAGDTGAMVVAAAGNENSNNDASPTMPCALPNENLICVASVTKTGARSGFSNYGRTTVDVGAPGGDGSGVANRDILSAKPAWAPLFSESFDTVPFPQWTATGTWGPAGGGAGGGNSVTDSPGADYAPNTSSMFQATTGIDLAGQRGCMIGYLLRLVGIEAAVDPSGDLVDAVGVGVFSGGAPAVGDEFAGSTPSGAFVGIEKSIASYDGTAGITPTFTFRSDEDVQGDGAYVDNFNLLCRGSAYDNAIGADEASAGHSYTAISGTSMAAPHVAGVAALVRAADTNDTPAQVVQALRDGAKPVPGMTNVTATGGVVDAVRAIDAALALPKRRTSAPAPPKPPSKARILRAKVNRRGVVTIVLRGGAGNRGVATLTANIARAARVMRVARKRFRIGPARRATVRLKLKRPAVRQLKRKRRLRVRAKIVLTNRAGLKSTRTRTVRLRLRRQP